MIDYLQEKNLVNTSVEVGFLPNEYIKEELLEECKKAMQKDEFINVTDM